MQETFSLKFKVDWPNNEGEDIFFQKFVKIGNH